MMEYLVTMALALLLAMVWHIALFQETAMGKLRVTA
jgi:hypothetical protein